MKKLKEITKRIATLGFAAALMINSLPATAFAAEIDDPDAAVVMEEGQQESGGEILKDESESDAAVSDEYTGSAAGEGNSDTAGSTAEGSEKSDDAVTPSTAAVSEDSRNEDKKLPAFNESQSIDGVRITVEAKEGVFPEGATLSVEKVTLAQEKQAEEAVESERDEDKQVAASYTYDIKVLDKDGNEIQPADESKVKVSFILEEVGDANLTTNVYHIVEEDSQNGGDSGEAAPKEGDDLKNSRNEEADAVNSAELTAEKLEVETNGDTAIVETDGFSLYTVEFTYDSMQYVLPGDSEVALSDILEAVGLSGEASDVEVSKSSLFSAEKNEGGEWIVTAHKAFSTKEWMKVLIGGVVYEITVTDTDDQEIGSWADLQAQFDSASTEENNPTLITLSDDVTAGEGDSALVIPTDRYVTLDLNGHTIDRGLAGKAPAENGSVIRVEGNLTLSDNSTGHTGKITGGNSTRNGGGVIVSGTFTMEGGTIDHCTAINDQSCGGGVYVKGTFTMKNNGTISGCGATNGGGVYVDEGGTFRVSGAPVISGNMTVDSANNVALGHRTTITVFNELTSGAKIYVFAGNKDPVATAGEAYTLKASDMDAFHSDGDGSLVAALDSDGKVKFFTPWGALQAQVNNASTDPGAPTKITLTGDLTADTRDNALWIPGGTYVTLDLNGYTIDRGLTNQANNGNVITVEGHLTISDNSTAHTGTITGGNNTGNGGGVYVRESGEFTMKGGTISGCNVTGNNSKGGGVYVDNNGKFTMEGGTITGCKAPENGGGVYVESNGKFTMEDGIISNCNTDNGGYGGGVSVYGGEFTMKGGTITGCNASENGGGVYVGNNGEFTMSGGTITGCKAVWGGGVYAESNGKFTMEDGIISNCNTDNGGYGGGVSVYGGEFTMKGGTITGCKAVWGGGVCVDSNGTFTMEGGTISGCIVNGLGCKGGGVYVANGKFIIKSGTISGCSAGDGGGVYVASDGMFTMDGGTISGCNATGKDSSSGGGVYVANGKFIIKSGVISGCNVTGDNSKGGGVYVNDGGTFQVYGAPVIRDNKKDGNANNVELDVGKTITVTGALTDNAEIWVNAGKGVTFATKGDSYSITDTDLAKFHSDTDSSLVAAEDSDGSVKFFTPWGALQAKFNNASRVAGSPTRITLTGDVTADAGDSALLIPAGKYVTLDLNGHTIDRGLAVQPVGNNDNVITVSGNLTLTDSSSAHTGTITGGNNGQFSGGGVSVNGGTFTMSGGTISGCNAALGGGVNVDSGTFTMTGGTITGCNAYNSGGGVCVNGSFTMNGGTFTMTGGTITDCNATSHGGRGGGVYVEGGGKFTMEGGTIDRCNTAAAGGGVYNHGTFNMSDGTITNCSVTGDESNGGGVYIEDRGTFKVRGTPVISGNMKGSTSANNVELGGKTISVNGALTSGAEIHVNAGLGVPIAEKGGDRTTALTETEAGYFKSDVDSNLLGGLNDAGQVVLKDPLPALTGASNLIYNGTEQTPALIFESATLEKGTDYTVSYKKVDGSTETEISGSPKDAGDYKAVVTGKGRYAGIFEAAFTIDRKEVTVSSGIAAKDRPYDGTTNAELITRDAVFTGKCTRDSLTVSGTGKFEDASAGINKTVTINQSSLTLGGTSSGNYVLASDVNQTQTTATINKKKLTITGITVADKEYDGSTTATTDTTNAVVTGLVDGESVEFTVSGAFKNANVGENKKVTLSNWTLTSGGENYEIDEEKSQKEAFARITGIQVYITGITAVNKEYDGNKTAAVTGTAVLKKVKDDSVVSTLTVSSITAEFADKKVGDGKAVSITGGTLDSPNYTLMPDKTTGLTANITPKPVTITGLSAKNKVYDTTTAATVTGTAVIDGKFGYDDITVSAGTAAFDNAYVNDNITVTFTGYSLTGEDASNYTLSAQPANVTANITKATPTIAKLPTASEITYGKTLLDSNLTDGIVKLGETVVHGNFAWSNNTIAPSVSDSGKTGYEVTFTPADNTNFNTTTCRVKLTVNKADIPDGDISAPTAKTGLSYNGSAQPLVNAGSITGNIGTMWYAVTDSTVTTAPSFDGDSEALDKKWSTSIPTATDAGTYSVWYKVKGDGNHNDKETSGPIENISINRKAVTVTANDQSVEVNDSIVTGKDQATLSGGVSGHTLRSVSISTSQSTGALGEYPDVIVPASAKINDASGKDVTANYNISYSNGKLTVTNTRVYISGISAENKVYDKTTAAQLTGTPVLKRVKNDETVKGLTVSGYTASFADYNAGEDKSVTVSGGILAGDNASDYTLMTDKTNEKLSLKAGITPKEVSLEWGGTSFTYDGSDHFPAATAGGLIEGDSCTVKVTGGQKDAGSYTATAESLSDRNYKLPADRIKSFTISKAESSVVTAPAAKSGLVYNGTALALVVPGTADGGTMQYALGNEEGPAEAYSDLIPESTDAGTYYVWYKVKGDNNHNDTAEYKLPVVIAKASHREIALDAMIIADNTREIDLSSYIEEDGSLGTPVKTDVNNIIDGDPAVVGTTLRFKAVVDIVDKSATISVPVEDSKNYETYNIVISVRGVDKYTQELIFEKTSVTLKAGETFTNKLNGAETSVSYKSSDESVAKVDSDGKLTAEGNGKAVITATAAETDEYYGASAEYTVEVEGGSDKVPLTGTGDHYTSENDNIAPVSSSGKVTDLKLDFSHVAESGVDPAGLKMTAVKGTKLTTTGKLKDKNSFKTTGGVKVHVDKKTLTAKITCKKSGSATLTMEDGITYTVNFTVQKPRAQKAAKSISKGGSTVIKNIKELFGTDIDAGVLTVQKQKHSQAKVSDNSIYIDPKEKDSIKLQYKYLNKKYKLTMKVK